ncbi:MAG: hypothetical protein RTU09_06105 [Candidatus Thorarchaeota archaeon]
MKNRILTIIFLAVLIISAFCMVPSLPRDDELIASDDDIEDTSPMGFPEGLTPEMFNSLADVSPFQPDDYDLGKVLMDRANNYKLNYEPWRSKAAIHAVAYDEATGFMALGGGYLYDNEIHIFRLNAETNEFDKVWDTGDSVLQGDVLDLDFGDTDLNNFLEIAAACADGHVYVFEQRHLYDPYANTENMFDHVWTSPSMVRAFTVKIDDVDRDYRPDIIAGGWDGYVHMYEYDNHSGYPFSSEHWITYREVTKLYTGEKVYTLETGDTNYNGLPEIVVGTREGTVFVFENDGISMMINGQPFPLINDNRYYLNWTSQNYTWTPILDMDVGEMNGANGDEIALVAQGQGVFTLTWSQHLRTYVYEKVYKGYEEWETFGFWGLDYYVDSGVEAWNVTYNDPVNLTLHVPEPIAYNWSEDLGIFLPDASVYPYTTGMAMMPDGNFSTFDCTDPSIDNATEIVDFGLDEEGTGSANDAPDILMTFRYNLDGNIFSHLNFSVSQDGTDFEQVSINRMDIAEGDNKILKIDVDDALGRRKWDWFRYAKISIYNTATYEINSLELKQVYNLLTEALSVTIGPLRLDGDGFLADIEEANKILIGTVVGEFIGVEYHGTAGYEIVWESGDDDHYTLGANVWDIHHIPSVRSVPTWRHLKSPNPSWVPPTLIPPSGMNYNSWTYGTVEMFPWGSGKKNYFVGTDFHQIRAYNMLGELDEDVNDDLIFINEELDYWAQNYTSVEVPQIISEYSFLPMVVVGSFNPEIDPYDFSGMDSRAKIRFYYRPDLSLPFTDSIDLWQFDTNGELSHLVNYAQATPKMDFVDIDEDDDMDFVVSNGHLYLARNSLVESGLTQTNFTLVRGYFDDINNLDSGKVWGQPEMFDLDSDGDLDLILSYGNKNGATCFMNHGTTENPVWIEDKRVFSNPGLDSNMKYLNLTDIRIVPNTGGYSYELQSGLFGYPVEADYSMVSMNVETHQMWWAEPKFDTSDTYIVASYPRVVTLDFSLMTGTDYTNLGSHIHESWSNDGDLANWTLTIASGDIDGDGNGEIIVGDYDNNVYAFEHLGNNTYKRMFRSFDLNYSVNTDISPYYYEELEGIEGNFIRKIWHHAEHLVTDCDLDQDGLKEIIVAAGLQVYIFENKNLTGGDQLQFVYEFDLRQSDLNASTEFDWVSGITAMDAGDDIDYDGQNELVIAAGPFLFVFNVPVGGFENTEDNGYFVTSYGLSGRYALLGNPVMESDYKYAWINALALCDTDKDGYREIILGGVHDTRYMRDNGFVYIYECRGGTFYKVWEAPEEVTYWNPVSVLKLDDQDYDGYQEIIIGHTNGFDMWEWIPGTDSQYRKVEYVTASPNYPRVPLQTTMMPGLDSYVIGSRAECDLAQYTDHYTAEYIMTYLVGNRLYGKNYEEDTGSWMFGLPWTGPGNAFSYPTPLGMSDQELQPDMLFLSNGDMYMTWKVHYLDGTRRFWIVMFDLSTSNWLGPYEVRDDSDTSRWYPRVAELNSTHLLWMYVREYPFSANRIWYVPLPKDLTSRSFPVGSGEWAGLDFNDYDSYNIHSYDAIDLPNGDVTIAFSATNNKITKADYDIYSVVLPDGLELRDAVVNSTAHQATSAYEDQMYPSIDYLRNDGQTLIVTYENIGAEFEDSLGMVASSTKGAIWSIPENLNAIPDYVDRIEDPDQGTVDYQLAGVPLFGVRAYAPAVVALKNEGFMYVNTFTHTFSWHYKIGNIDVWLHGPVGDIVYGINPQSDWAYNHLRNVVDLDVGDTDRDGRREVVVGFGDQIGVYEMKSSNNGSHFMSYEEAWLSEPYENPVTGVTVYDSNGNAFPEIGISTERGDVYVIEYQNPSEGSVDLMVSETLWSYNTTGYGSAGYFETFFAADVDNDGKDEIIAGEYDTGLVFALDDDGILLWSNADSTGGIREIAVIDFDDNGTLNVLVGSDDSNLYCINALTGNTEWTFSDAPNSIYTIAVDDLDADGQMEVCFGTADSEIWVVNSTGHWIYNSTPSGGLGINDIVIGNFTGGDTLSVAYSEVTNIVMFLSFSGVRIANPLNGTVYYQSPDGIVLFSTPVNAYDFNQDGVDELMFSAQYSLQVLDPISQMVYYNSTIIDRTYGLIVADVDDDGTVEALVQTIRGAFLVDVSRRKTEWQYSCKFTLLDMALGHFGGSDGHDVVLASVNSGAIVLDGNTGLPIWFNVTESNALRCAAAADLDGDGVDSAVVWGEGPYAIYACDGVKPVFPDEEPAFVAHELYYDIDLGSDIDTIWVEDISGDSRDEIVVSTDDNFLMLLNGTTSEVIWSVTIADTIREVRFGQFTGSASLDLAVLFGSGTSSFIAILDGDDGSEFAQIVPMEPNHAIRDCETGEFNTGHSGDEIVVLFEKTTATTKGYLAWYDRGGNHLYTSSINATSTGNHLSVGNYLGGATLDAAFGGYDHNLRVYNGSSGFFMWGFSNGKSIYDLVSGGFDGDVYEDLAFLDSSENVTTVSGATHMNIYTINIPLGDFNGFYAADLYNNDNIDELVVNWNEIGIRGFDDTGNEVWFYEMPLTVTPRVTFGDMDLDGHTDLVVTNYDYVSTVSGATGAVIWHHLSNDSIYAPAVGIFYEASSAPDVVMAHNSKLLVVSGSWPAPIPPLPVIPAPPLSMSFAEMVLIAAATGLPLSALVLFGFVYMRKKRRRGE